MGLFLVGQGSKTSSFPRVGGPPGTPGTGTLSGGTISDRTLHQGMAGSPFAAFGEIVDALAVPTAVLNTAGIVVACNQALLEHLHRPRPEVIGEPLLGWIARASERAAFGRAFMGMRPRLPGHRFSLEISLAPALGRPLPCLLRP